jgi:hypothetical protein
MFEFLFSSKIEISVYEKFAGFPADASKEPYFKINYVRNETIVLQIQAKGRENERAVNPWLQDWLNDLASNPENGIKEVHYTCWEFAEKNSLKKFLGSLDDDKFEIIYS